MQRDNPAKKFLPSHPIYELAYYIVPEEREILGRKGRLSLCSTKHHGLELWKARYLGALIAADPSYRPKNTPGRAEFLSFFPTPDGKAVYLQEEIRDYKGELDDGTRAEISGDKVDNCTLTELLQKLIMHNFTRLAIAYRQNAAAGLVNKYTSVHRNLDDDPDANEPSLPSRIQPRVPKLRISDPKDDIAPQVNLRHRAATRIKRATAPTPDAMASKSRDPLVLLVADKKAPTPVTVTKSDSHTPVTVQEHCLAGLVMLRAPVQNDAGHSQSPSLSRSQIMAALVKDPSEMQGGGGDIGASVPRRSRRASF